MGSVGPLGMFFFQILAEKVQSEYSPVNFLQNFFIVLV